MNIYYEGEDIGTRRVDFFAEDNIMIELKNTNKIRRRSLGTSNELLPSLQFTYWITDKLRG